MYISEGLPLEDRRKRASNGIIRIGCSAYPALPVQRVALWLWSYQKTLRTQLVTAGLYGDGEAYETKGSFFVNPYYTVAGSARQTDTVPRSQATYKTKVLGSRFYRAKRTGIRRLKRMLSTPKREQERELTYSMQLEFAPNIVNPASD